MKKLSATDKSIILLWVVLLLLGAAFSAIYLYEALIEISVSLNFRRLRLVFGLLSAFAILGYLGYALARGLGKGAPNMEMLKGATLLAGRMPALVSLLLIAFVLWQGEASQLWHSEDPEDVAYMIPGGLMLGVLGFYTRRRFRDRMEIKKDPAE